MQRNFWTKKLDYPDISGDLATRLHVLKYRHSQLEAKHDQPSNAHTKKDYCFKAYSFFTFAVRGLTVFLAIMWGMW